jgi:hypothetical protein
MQRNNANIVVTDKVKAFIYFRKLKGKSLDTLSCLKDFVEENILETSDTGIYQCIKDYLVNLQFRFSKYFPEAVFHKY